MTTFRANEEAQRLREEMLHYYTQYLPPEDRERSRETLENIIVRFGPVVDAYPHWHPLVTGGEMDHLCPATVPGARTGYEGLDHTRLLRNAIITCPYSEGRRIVESVEKLKQSPVCNIKVDEIIVPLYHPKAKPILIWCAWDNGNADKTIPLSLAVPLLLEIEVPCWRTAEVAETWETMRRYILGSPCGSRSSLFVNEETGQALKSLWNMLIKTGIFGPVRR